MEAITWENDSYSDRGVAEEEEGEAVMTLSMLPLEEKVVKEVEWKEEEKQCGERK